MSSLFQPDLEEGFVPAWPGTDAMNRAMEFASEHAIMYKNGFASAMTMTPYTCFESEPWKLGYKAAVAIFGLK